MRRPSARVAALLLLFVAGTAADDAARALVEGDARKALQLYESRIAADAGDVAAAAGAVEASLALDRVEDALERAAALREASGDQPLALAAYGRALFRAGRLAEAEEALAVLEKMPAAPARGLVALARLHAARGGHDRASALAGRALEGGPDDPFVIFWASEMIGDRERADRLLAQYIEAAPGGQEDWLEAARGTLRLHEALGDRPVWIVDEAPARVELPLRLAFDDSGRKLGYVVEAHIGPKDKPVRLMLDTGSSGLFLVERIARKRGFEFLSEETAFGGGGDKRHRNRRGVFPGFRLGDLRYRDALAGTTRRELEPYGRYHGLLGIQALSGYRVTLDLPGQRLILVRHDAEDGLQGGEPFWMVSGQMLVEAGVREGPTGLFLFDTGATWSILSSALAARLEGVTREATGGVRGFGGRVEGASVVRGAEVLFAGQGSGGEALRAFDMSLRSRVADVEVSGFVGLDLLSEARITIDTVEQRVWLEQTKEGGGLRRD